jgi:hypothetical protein
MQFNFWDAKILWWVLLAAGVIIALLVRSFLKKK